MQSFDYEYILAHGSRNLFVMIDATKYPSIETNNSAEFVRNACREFQSDGLLFLEQVTGVDGNSYLAMNMYNTDGSQAEMCGNGMRIVARLADQRHLDMQHFTLYSGGRPYPIHRATPLAVTVADGSQELIPNYGVEIAIRRASADFTLSTDGFVAGEILDLDPTLKFTYLNLGNPHIVAQVESVDYDLLSRLGERVKEITNIFPHGVNVSFMQKMGNNEIFVATYERGVGLTASCGTAMTASSTTAALLGLCEWGAEITVRNRGGLVKCICNQSEDGALMTQLIGNATYIESGTISVDGMSHKCTKSFDNEVEAWDIVTK